MTLPSTCLGVCVPAALQQEAIAWSPDGSRLALLMKNGEKVGLQIWDGRTGKVLLHCQDVGGSLFSLSRSPDGRYLVAGNMLGKNGEYSTLQFWDAHTGKALFTYDAPRYPTNLTWSVDSRLLATITPKDWYDPSSGWFRHMGAAMPENFFLQVYQVGTV